MCNNKLKDCINETSVSKERERSNHLSEQRQHKTNLIPFIISVRYLITRNRKRWTIFLKDSSSLSIFNKPYNKYNQNGYMKKQTQN